MNQTSTHLKLGRKHAPPFKKGTGKRAIWIQAERDGVVDEFPLTIELAEARIRSTAETRYYLFMGKCLATKEM